MTRILLLTPADVQAPAAAFSAGLTDSDTAIVHRRVAYASTPPVGAHDWALADLAMLAAGQHAQEEGFDAVCVGDMGDYGANALRSVLDIPVIAAGRASMLYALSLGARFSVAASARDHVRIGKLVHEYALDHQCAGVHLLGEDGELPAALDEADVVVLAASPAGASRSVRAPLVEPLPLIVKLAESMTGLGLTHSRRAYPAPQVRKGDLIDALSRSGAAS